MEIIEILTNQKSKTSKIIYKGFRLFKAIETGNYFLSLQGSKHHYSSPRRICEPAEYTSFEVQVQNKARDPINPLKSSKMRQFKRFKELKVFFGGGNCHAAGWVPVDLINDLYLFLKNN